MLIKITSLELFLFVAEELCKLLPGHLFQHYLNISSHCLLLVALYWHFLIWLRYMLFVRADFFPFWDFEI